MSPSESPDIRGFPSMHRRSRLFPDSSSTDLLTCFCLKVLPVFKIWLKWLSNVYCLSFHLWKIGGTLTFFLNTIGWIAIRWRNIVNLRWIPLNLDVHTFPLKRHCRHLLWWHLSGHRSCLVVYSFLIDDLQSYGIWDCLTSSLPYSSSSPLFSFPLRSVISAWLFDCQSINQSIADCHANCERSTSVKYFWSLSPWLLLVYSTSQNVCSNVIPAQGMHTVKWMRYVWYSLSDVEEQDLQRFLRKVLII